NLRRPTTHSINRRRTPQIFFYCLADASSKFICTHRRLCHAGSNWRFLGRAVLLQQRRCFLSGCAIRSFFQVLEIFWQFPATCLHCLGVELARAVRRTDQRTRHNGKAQFLGVLGVRNELLRANPTLNWVEPRTRTQVLRNGDDVRAYRAHIAQSFLNLFLSLTHAQDQVGLGDQTEVVCLLQNIQRTLITECRADTLENTRHGFQVVSENRRASLEDFLPQVWLAGEVRGEVFYTRVRVLLVDLANHFSI